MAAKNSRSLLQFIILLGVGVVLIWLSLRQVAPEKDNIFKSFREANYFWVTVSLIISLLSHFLRAYRWNYLLEPAGHKVNLFNSNCHVLIGYLANYGIPRMGEITRCTLATKYDKVPFEIALGTVITERIIDFILFVIIFLVTLLIEFNELIGLAKALVFDKLSSLIVGVGENRRYLSLFIITVVVLFIAFFFTRKKFSAILKGKLGNVIKGMGEGLGSVRKTKNPLAFIALSILIWLCYFYSLYTCFFALKGTEHLGQNVCLTLLLFGTLGVIFAPGGLGAYPFILYTILTGTYGVAEAPSFALPWLSWAGQFALILACGLIALALLPIYNKNRYDIS